MEVALLAEGVDRNLKTVRSLLTVHKSPSSRRAWIEISLHADHCGQLIVALLAEGVDRNYDHMNEIYDKDVALLAEGVDRNLKRHFYGLPDFRRPPRGGRG